MSIHMTFRKTPKLLWSWRALRAEDRALVREAFVLLTVVRFGLHFLRFSTLRRVLVRFTPEQQSLHDHASRLGEPSGSAMRVTWAVSTVARKLPGSTCLAQALTVETMLGRRACGGRMCFGVKERGRDEPIQAHAWIERDGQVVLGALPNLREYHLLSAPAGLDRVKQKESRN